MEFREASALARSFGLDVPGLGIAQLIATSRGKAPHAAKGSGSYISLANETPFLIPANQHHGSMGQQRPVSDLLLKGQLNGLLVNVDLHDRL